MTQASPLSVPHPSGLRIAGAGRVGVFVDGENLQPWVAASLLEIAANCGCVPTVCRVYGNCEHLNDWMQVPGFEIIHTGVAGNGGRETVKNAADIKIAVDVMEFVLTQNGQTAFLCSSDRDFTPLAYALRKMDRTIIGIGEAKTSKSFQRACHHFEVLSKRSTCSHLSDTEPDAALVAKVRKVLGPYTSETKGMPLNAFGAAMGQRQKVKIRDYGYRTWRIFAEKNPRTCELVGEGDATRIRLAPRQ